MIDEDDLINVDDGDGAVGQDEPWVIGVGDL